MNQSRTQRFQVKFRFAFSFTILSNASRLTSADVCFITWFHQAGDENRCIIAIVHRSSTIGGTTVGSRGQRFSKISGYINLGRSTLGADNDAHALMSLLTNQRKKLLGQARVCICRCEILPAIFTNVKDSLGNNCSMKGQTLCASSTTSTFPVPTSALVNNLRTISKIPHADAESMKGSDKSMIVIRPASNRGGIRRRRAPSDLSVNDCINDILCASPADCAILKSFFFSSSNFTKPLYV